jgi:hypothetical protein
MPESRVTQVRVTGGIGNVEEDVPHVRNILETTREV